VGYLRPSSNCAKGTENPIVLGPVETHVFSRGVRPICGQSIAMPVHRQRQMVGKGVGRRVGKRVGSFGLFNLEYLSVEERIPKKGPAALVGPGEKE
jgi:hypothetical protein